MRKYIDALIDWMAERLIGAAAMRAAAIVQRATETTVPEALPAPQLPSIAYLPTVDYRQPSTH